MIGSTTLRVLRQRDPFLLVSSSALSAYGDGFLAVALAGLMLDLGGPPALTASLAITYVAAIAASPLAGHLADRLPRRGILIAVDVVRAVVMIVIALLVREGLVSLFLFLALNAVSTVMGAVFRAARTSLMPTTVRGDDLFALNAVDGMVRTSATIIGPALCATVLLLGADRAWLFFLNGLSFVLSGALVAFLRGAGAPGEREIADVAPQGRHWGDGLRFLARARHLHWSLALVFLNHAAAGAMFVILPTLAGKSGGDVGIGWVQTALGAGFVLGMLASGALGRWDARLTSTAGVALFGAILALAGLSPSLAALAAVACLMGFAACLADAPLTTVLQLGCPDSVRGRVSSAVDALGCAGLLAGAAAFGALAPAVDLLSASAVVGGVVTAFALGSVLLRGSLDARAPSRRLAADVEAR